MTRNNTPQIEVQTWKNAKRWVGTASLCENTEKSLRNTLQHMYEEIEQSEKHYHQGHLQNSLECLKRVKSQISEVKQDDGWPDDDDYKYGFIDKSVPAINQILSSLEDC